MARRPVMESKHAGKSIPALAIPPGGCLQPEHIAAEHAKTLVTVNVPPGGLRVAPGVAGAFVRLRPLPGATSADLDATGKALLHLGVEGVLRMPVAPVGVAVNGEVLSANGDPPMMPRGETLEDALKDACEQVLNQEGVRDLEERTAVVDAAFDTLRKVGV